MHKLMRNALAGYVILKDSEGKKINWNYLTSTKIVVPSCKQTTQQAYSMVPTKNESQHCCSDYKL